MVTKISDFIFQKPILGKENKFSSAEEINTFFAKLPKPAIKAWPLNLEEQGLKVNYLSAHLSNNNWKEDEFLIVQAELINQNNQHATIEQEFRFGANDQLIVNMVSLYNQDTGLYPRGMRIARIITEQNFKFISAYDKKIKPVSPSYLSVFASSERIKQKIRTCGGYVWANNGFDFQDKSELDGIRGLFKKFLAQYGVTISDKNLKLFTKPCHFAAYGCGIMADINGKKYYLGKAFLLNISWSGIQKTSARNSVERKYATAYYNENISALRRKTAIKTLGKNYRNFLKQTYKKELLQQIANKIKSYRRLAMIKLNRTFQH